MLKIESENQEDVTQVRNAAIRLLAQREQSQKELLRKLSQKGFSEQVSKMVVSALADDNLQSQQRYCDMLIKARAAKGYGLNRIIQELSGQGIDEQTFRQCPHLEEIDWFELCRHQKLKKFGEGQLTEWKQQQKCRRFLYQRGFSEEQIRYAIDE